MSGVEVVAAFVVTILPVCLLLAIERAIDRWVERRALRRRQADLAQRLALDDLAAYDDLCAGRPTTVDDRP